MKEFDLKDYEAAETGEMEVMGLDEEPLMVNGEPVVLVMYGPGSKQHAAATAKATAKTRNSMMAAMRGKPIKEGDDEARKDQIEKLVACTAEVKNFPLSAREIFTNPLLGYITDQAAKYIEDWKNFKKPSLSN